MRQITKVALATAATATTAALLFGEGGTVLAAARPAAGAPLSAASTTGTATTVVPAAATAATAGISYREAIRIARKRVPGARVTEVEREWEHGRRVWKVELRKGRWEYEVHVSAASGKVTRVKRKLDD
ncbi:PepSY domain-containing protein [Streptosporangium sp. NPDC004379]|uniref:PepSY domain-containing protein n=1 Tax=Streptosporangium sp. NPDC004379 TaxID=3366189 RepID=UPI0036D04428